MSRRIKQFLCGMLVGGLFSLVVYMINAGHYPTYLSQALSFTVSLVTLYAGSKFVSG
jgi:hypothetical protein